MPHVGVGPVSLRELGSSAGDPGAVGGTDCLSLSSAAAAMNAVHIGSVGMLCLTKKSNATCTFSGAQAT